MPKSTFKDQLGEVQAPMNMHGPMRRCFIPKNVSSIYNLYIGRDYIFIKCPFGAQTARGSSAVFRDRGQRFDNNEKGRAYQ
jgi:hypothetical protein